MPDKTYIYNDANYILFEIRIIWVYYLQSASEERVGIFFTTAVSCCIHVSPQCNKTQPAIVIINVFWYETEVTFYSANAREIYSIAFVSFICRGWTGTFQEYYAKFIAYIPANQPTHDVFICAFVTCSFCGAHKTGAQKIIYFQLSIFVQFSLLRNFHSSFHMN